MNFFQSNKKAKNKKGSRTDCSAYLRYIPTIEKLIEIGWLNVDLREIHVSVDYRLHMTFMDEDRKYLAFFDKIRAYMNYKRGFLQVKKLIEPEDRINFLVFRKSEIHTLNGKEVPLPDLFDAEAEDEIGTKEKIETLLVGFATATELEYVPFEKAEDDSDETNAAETADETKDFS